MNDQNKTIWLIWLWSWSRIKFMSEEENDWWINELFMYFLTSHVVICDTCDYNSTMNVVVYAMLWCSDKFFYAFNTTIQKWQKIGTFSWPAMFSRNFCKILRREQVTISIMGRTICKQNFSGLFQVLKSPGFVISFFDASAQSWTFLTWIRHSRFSCLCLTAPLTRRRCCHQWKGPSAIQIKNLFYFMWECLLRRTSSNFLARHLPLKVWP
jgi:hypothetical protein